ncbi:hypothetical protein JG687_00015092 [Phytophthora cactorum]|uniref:Uncharacterized protein n=1 Tax=Phytophthora cactorum TaxID=29920 RepID=A0A8T1TUA5_9STRA|nr:hypothetical protein PC120_g21580 [Phytophthora cactorum]KAG3045423.1 hypothetical protein PC121_g21278 [Phytophthora cactorum]KAG6949068.1 hypothetical protein JG687_00015092 [Phytophthora cactorum]
MAMIGERSVGFESSDDDNLRILDEVLGCDGRDESTSLKTKRGLKTREESALSTGSRRTAKPFSRNLADELSAVAEPHAAYDDGEPSSKVTLSSDALGTRPRSNGYTPVAKIMAKGVEKIKTSAAQPSQNVSIHLTSAMSLPTQLAR